MVFCLTTSPCCCSHSMSETFPLEVLLEWPLFTIRRLTAATKAWALVVLRQGARYTGA